jgi:carbon monoxide dehydrogenase subunit G
MSMTIALTLGYEFDVKASADEVYATLADVPHSASFYPKVETLEDLGKGSFRWEMEKIGLGQFSMQTVYASKYVGNKAKRTIVWTPVAGIGNAQVAGSWKIKAGKKSTNIVLSVEAELTLALPALMKAVVAPLVEAEFEKMTEQYIDNLIEHFGGEV